MQKVNTQTKFFLSTQSTVRGYELFGRGKKQSKYKSLLYGGRKQEGGIHLYVPIITAAGLIILSKHLLKRTEEMNTETDKAKI